MRCLVAELEKTQRQELVPEGNRQNDEPLRAPVRALQAPGKTTHSVSAVTTTEAPARAESANHTPPFSRRTRHVSHLFVLRLSFRTVWGYAEHSNPRIGLPGNAEN